jgi:hypothetical protein
MTNEMLATHTTELKKAVRLLRDAILSMSRHASFNHSIDSEQLWRPAITRAYELVGLPEPAKDRPFGETSQDRAFRATPSAAETGSEKMIESLTALASIVGKGGDDPWIVNGVGFGYVVGAIEFLEGALGPEFVSEKLYALADLMAGRAADTRVQAG